jgi:hypothetical protein
MIDSYFGARDHFIGSNSVLGVIKDEKTRYLVLNFHEPS